MIKMYNINLCRCFVFLHSWFAKNVIKSAENSQTCFMLIRYKKVFSFKPILIPLHTPSPTLSSISKRGSLPPISGTIPVGLL